MPYREPIFVQGGYYHVYNRGLNKQKIFHFLADYVRFVEKISELVSDRLFSVHAYCLMPNHFHLLLEQSGEASLSHSVGRLSNSYARYFNLRHTRKGQLFEGRFKAKKIENDEYLLQLVRYIHRNPVAVGLSKTLGAYRWSSYQSYMGDVAEPFVTCSFVLDYFSQTRARDTFVAFSNESVDDMTLRALEEELIDAE